MSGGDLMSLSSKIILRGGLSEVRDRLLRDLRQQFDAGQPFGRVEVTEPEVGMQLGVAISLLCSEIEAAGFRVLHSSNPEWSDPRQAEIIVASPAPSGRSRRVIDLRDISDNRNLRQTGHRGQVLPRTCG